MLRSAMLTLSHSDRNHCRVSNITRRPNYFTGQRYSGHSSCSSGSIFARASHWGLYTCICIDEVMDCTKVWLDEAEHSHSSLTEYVDSHTRRKMGSCWLHVVGSWKFSLNLEFIYQSSDSLNKYDLRLIRFWPKLDNSTVQWINKL